MPGSLLQPDEPRQLSAIADGQKTLMLIEVDLDHAVPWMASIDADEQMAMAIGPKSKLGHPAIMNAAFVDGHVEFLSSDLPADQRRAMLPIVSQVEAPTGAAN